MVKLWKGLPSVSAMVSVMAKQTERIYNKIESLAGFATNLASFGDRVAYRYFDKERNVISMTYEELSQKILRQAAGYAKLGLAGKRIAIIGETSVEWVCSYVATVAGGGIAIPLDRELEVSEIERFLEFAEADAIVYSASFNTKFENLAKGHPTVSKLIAMDPAEDAEANDRVIGYEKLMELGAAGVEEGYAYPVCEDHNRMAEMLFTSGTTGSSKCVMLSEKNIYSAVNAACESVNFTKDDKIVSVLPIHHTYELCIMLAALSYGMNVAINDSLKRVLKNFALFKPTGLVLVPLFVSTMYRKIWETAKKSKKDKALRMLIKLSHVLRGAKIDLRKKFFAQVTGAFGGELNKIICGGAPLNPEMAKTFNEFGIQVCEGYGITECSPLLAVNPYFAPKNASVGPAVPCCKLRIDVDHTDENGRQIGEIQAKGDNVMLGYYKNPEETAKVFTEDGWFCTGDIGYMDEDGYVFITGRKKFVIVLENGKNVFPEEIEEYLASIEEIGECVVLGRKKEGSDEITLTALVYPQLDKFERGAAHETIEETIRTLINKLNRKLVGYKQIRVVEFRYEPFEKTTSKKIKRHLLK